MPTAQGIGLKHATPTGVGRRARRSHAASAHGRSARQAHGAMSLEGGGFLGGAHRIEERVAPCPPRAAARDAESIRPMSLLPESSIGLYNPAFERDSCGVGFVAELSGVDNRATVSSLHQGHRCSFSLPSTGLRY